MSAKRPSKTPQEQPMDQGQLFDVQISRTAPPSIGEVVEGGVYPDELPQPVEGNQSFNEAVHDDVVKEQKTRNRRRGNQGKHSPLIRDGNYQQIRLGDYLPDFGPVTERKWEDAKAHARELEQERLRRLGTQPTLASVMVETVAESLKMPEDEVPPILDTRKKLIALRDDARAGFMPTTHIEKNQAVEFLDYLPESGDSQDTARGIHRRLQEIYDHQLGVFRKQGYRSGDQKRLASESVTSVIQTYGDHLQDARRSYRHLTALDKIIENTPNPRLTLGELLRESEVDPAEGAYELIRYMDGLSLRADDEISFPFDPLHSIENRDIDDPRKNKIIEDPYTASEQSDAMAEHLARMLSTVRVGHIRQLVKQAKADQARRGVFWDSILRNTAYTFRDAAESARAM